MRSSRRSMPRPAGTCAVYAEQVLGALRQPGPCLHDGQGRRRRLAEAPRAAGADGASASGCRGAHRAVRAGARRLGHLHGGPAVGVLRHRRRGPGPPELVAARGRLDLSRRARLPPCWTCRGSSRASRRRKRLPRRSPRAGPAVLAEVTSEPCSGVHSTPGQRHAQRLMGESGEHDQHAPRDLAARPGRRHRVGDAGAAPRRRAGARRSSVRRGDAAHARRAGRRALLR